MNLNDCFNFNDFRKLAKKKLPAPIFHYIDGGSDDEVTLNRNTNAFNDCDLVPNILASVGEPADILDERTIPEIAASEADKIRAKYLFNLTSIPDVQATASPAPIEVTYLPNFVKLIKNQHRINIKKLTNNSLGI